MRINHNCPSCEGTGVIITERIYYDAYDYDYETEVCNDCDVCVDCGLPSPKGIDVHGRCADCALEAADTQEVKHP